ncbi:MAG: hypothetical protein AB7Q01_13005 [Gammaproteobacteria bacterium]
MPLQRHPSAALQFEGNVTETPGTTIDSSLRQHKRITMAKTPLWCGYLEAGDRSSAVLRDDRLETGNPTTIYLYNLARDEILQYSRELVEPKLRDLRGNESDLAEELKTAYAKARRIFKFNPDRVLSAPVRKQARSPNDRKPLVDEESFSPAEADIDNLGEEEWSDEEDE